MWKNVVERGRPQMVIWRMRVACWISKATNTHTHTHTHRLCVLYTHTYIYHDATDRSGPGSPHCPGFTITLRHTTLGRSPLDEWSASRRDLYLTTDIHGPPVGFEPTVPASERPQTHALDRTATGTYVRYAIPIVFHYNNGWRNASHYYVIRTFDCIVIRCGAMKHSATKYAVRFACCEKCRSVAEIVLFRTRTAGEITCLETVIKLQP